MPAFSGARRAIIFALTALSLGACSQTPVTVTLHSLQASGNVSFLCQGDDGNGLKLDECPDYETERRRILGLVTQTTTNEVAVVDLRDSEVVDLDPSVPGYTFARVGGRPGAIVSSPGGVASFVGVSGAQKNGIFALPTTCLTTPKVNPPEPGQPAKILPTRDLTSWAACSLSSAPGEISILVDATQVGDPSAPQARAACGSNDAQGPVDQSLHQACPADLTQEKGPFGRRKLLVALPEEHKLVLLDAQALLDRAPGKFEACQVEATYTLQANVATGTVMQHLPDNLDPAKAPKPINTCLYPTYPPSQATAPVPAGMALSGSTLYVADSALPVVHVIDVTDPCAPSESARSLLPSSYEAPSRTVTTSRLAVSPLTPMNKQYLYAIDPGDKPASVLVFDLSDTGETGRAPVVFDGAARQPFSAPDRLRFASPAKDVNIVMRDFPTADPTTGVGQFGLTCDPDPTHDPNSPGALYRSNADFTAGASPLNLRGTFGFVMLENGQIPVIDIEDLDQPCRRPIFANTSDTPDFRGCKGDPDVTYFTERNPGDANAIVSNAPTVTDESSCNVVEANQPRANAISRSDSIVGLRAPTLRSLPQFSNPVAASVVGAADQPRILPVAFASSDPSVPADTLRAQVNLNGQLYADCGDYAPPQGESWAPCNQAPQELSTNPLTATSNGVTLPPIEPRSYVANDNLTLTYEGRVLPLPDRTSGFLNQQADGSWVIQDPDASFCSSGVEDATVIKQEGQALGIPDDALAAWSIAHADYVQITGDFLPDEDKYWSEGAGKSCASPLFPSVVGHDSCVAEFGGIDSLTALFDTRELTIVNAFTDHLLVTARNASTVDEIKCCFPSGTAYTVRASHQWYLSSATALHDIAVGPNNACVHTADCNLRKQFFHSRAFEVCDSSAKTPDGTAPADVCSPTAANVGCVHDFTTGGVKPGQGSESNCIFENLTARFAVYRGSSPSARDMQFTWGTTGGFTPLAMALTPLSSSVLPQSMAYLPELGYMAVIDGSTIGLTLFDLNSLGVVPPSPLY